MPFNTATQPTEKRRSVWLSPGLIIPLLVVLVVGFISLSSYVKYHNFAAGSENGIVAQSDSNMNNLGQLTLKVKEALGVAKLNNEELDKVIKNAVQGRYGEDGAKQAMLWVKENYPGQYDPKLFVNVQQAILAGRTDFEQKQNLLIDKVRVYKNQTDYVWSGFWIRLAGYPKIKLEDYKPVVSLQAKRAFETKIDEGMEIK